MAPHSLLILCHLRFLLVCAEVKPSKQLVEDVDLQGLGVLVSPMGQPAHCSLAGICILIWLQHSGTSNINPLVHFFCMHF